jgi:hypothetical protein
VYGGELVTQRRIQIYPIITPLSMKYKAQKHRKKKRKPHMTMKTKIQGWRENLNKNEFKMNRDNDLIPNFRMLR